MFNYFTLKYIIEIIPFPFYKCKGYVVHKYIIYVNNYTNGHYMVFKYGGRKNNPPWFNVFGWVDVSIIFLRPFLLVRWNQDHSKVILDIVEPWIFNQRKLDFHICWVSFLCILSIIKQNSIIYFFSKLDFPTPNYNLVKNV